MTIVLKIVGKVIDSAAVYCLFKAMIDLSTGESWTVTDVWAIDSSLLHLGGP